ncbi:hypothetical protein D918_08936 [Trichuris suis]|nr:hypothetical protein D918_08936 [Trichuris suis]
MGILRGTTRNADGSIAHFEYGFLMVKNRTRTNPQILCGLITTTIKGYSLVEFGMVQYGFVDLELNNFITRSFDQRYNVYEVSQVWHASVTRYGVAVTKRGQVSNVCLHFRICR